LPPPLKVRRKAINEFLYAHAPITDPALLAEYNSLLDKAYPISYGEVAAQARWMRESLDKISRFVRSDWTKAWRGDPNLTLDKLLLIIDDIAACFDLLEEQAQHIQADERQFRASLDLPAPPRKRGGRTAQRVYFSRILKARFRREFGLLYPGVLATLEQVAFDLPEAVDESTVLKR
jgi:hypothetical protein